MVDIWCYMMLDDVICRDIYTSWELYTNLQVKGGHQPFYMVFTKLGHPCGVHQLGVFLQVGLCRERLLRARWTASLPGSLPPGRSECDAAVRTRQVTPFFREDQLLPLGTSLISKRGYWWLLFVMWFNECKKNIFDGKSPPMKMVIWGDGLWLF